MEFINIIRLKRAAKLLFSGEYSIYGIAAKVGFGSQSNFARNFQQQFNMTPTIYQHSKLQERKRI